MTKGAKLVTLRTVAWLTGLLLWSVVASGAQLVVDAKVPTSVFIDGTGVAQIFVPSTLTLNVEPGQHDLLFMINGSPRETSLMVLDRPMNIVVVGRTGITTALTLPEELNAVTAVEFRTTSNELLSVRVGDEKLSLPPGQVSSMSLDVGEYPMTVRGGGGTVVYGRGTLVISGAGHLVVQVAEGRMPEVSGPGGSFRAAAPQ